MSARRGAAPQASVCAITDCPGANVAVWGRNAGKNASAEASLAELGGDVLALACDVTDEPMFRTSDVVTIDWWLTIT